MREIETRSCPIDTSAYSEIIDVRSPSEYADDHVPGAINLPVLNDQEREHVGTIYKQQSPFKARREGSALVTANISRMLETHFSDQKIGYHPLVYCWRGGQRSNSLATILLSVGWRTSLIDGGYQCYRKEVMTYLEEQIPKLDLRVINGCTGSAKTDLLKVMESQGAQVLDLEGLANHRGSLLGSCGEQPAQRLFETRICEAIRNFSVDSPVYLEAESSRVGRLYSPVTLWRCMKDAAVIELTVPRDVRGRYLIEVYDHLCKDSVYLLECLNKLRERVGEKQLAVWENLIAAEDWEALVASLLTDHYDPCYLNGKNFKRVIQKYTLDDLGTDALSECAAKILAAEAMPV